MSELMIWGSLDGQVWLKLIGKVARQCEPFFLGARAGRELSTSSRLEQPPEASSFTNSPSPPNLDTRDQPPSLASIDP